MTAADISVKNSDFDTLGGRLGRAREAKNYTLEQIAELAGVELETIEAWECDRAEPRSNRLAMLAGILGVSPSWLLFGRGTSPSQDSGSAEMSNIELQLDQLKAQHEKIGAAIDTMQASLSRASSQSSG